MKSKSIFLAAEETPDTDGKDGEFNFLLPENGIIKMFGEIDRAMAVQVTDELLAINRDAPKDPIVVFINSPGGDVYSTTAIMDMFRAVSNKVIGIAHGMAASGAFYALQACDSRLMLSNSHLFWHEVIAPISYVTSESEARQRYNDYTRINNLLIEDFKKRAGMSQKTWDEVFKNRNDIFFNSKEAKKIHLVDGVLAEIKQLSKFLKGTKYGKDPIKNGTSIKARSGSKGGQPSKELPEEEPGRDSGTDDKKPEGTTLYT